MVCLQIGNVLEHAHSFKPIINSSAGTTVRAVLLLEINQDLLIWQLKIAVQFM